MKNKKSILKKVIVSLIAFISIVAVVFIIYVSNYYKADNFALNELKQSNVVKEDNIIYFKPNKEKDKKIGFIFYPGGKVEAKAYAPLLNKLANEGLSVFLVDMPFNLAVFDIDAANKVTAKFSKIDKWYIGGHSLGGAMASSHVSNNKDKYQGLILLAAYPINELNIKTLIIYGSNDKVLNTKKLPNIEDIIKIDGGNHALFGNYGKQSKDGVATITSEQQQELTVKHILNFIK